MRNSGIKFRRYNIIFKDRRVFHNLVVIDLECIRMQELGVKSRSKLVFMQSNDSTIKSSIDVDDQWQVILASGTIVKWNKKLKTGFITR